MERAGHRSLAGRGGKTKKDQAHTQKKERKHTLSQM